MLNRLVQIFVYISVFWTGYVSAGTITSSITLQSSSSFTLEVVVNQDTNIVQFKIAGPDSAWFGVAFGSTIMSNTYSLIASGTATVQERTLGAHSSGSSLASSLTVVSDLTVDNVRTVTAERNATVSSSYYDFGSVTDGQSIDMIWGVGSSTSFSKHTTSNRGSTS